MRIGVLGGTFNPVHNAHLRLAEEALDQLNLDCVKLVLSAVPPHKDGGEMAPVETRWELLQRACMGHEQLSPCALEIHRSGPSYTIDTLKEIRLGLNKTDEVFLLVGMDCACDFETWKSHEEILETAQVVVADRPGFMRVDVPNDLRGKLLFIEMPMMEISSSRIRSLVRQGRSIRYLVPEAVRDLILEKRVYAQAVQEAPS